uniref:Si:dkey-57n24.6 n=1 Tax=Cyprinus carpio carpio TaxID=630221 RepID=A0A9J8DAL0_CYPCA
MECSDLASPDTERFDEDKKILKKLSSNSTQLTDRESNADKSKDPYMEMPESSPEDEQTITTSTTDSSYIVTCTVSIALAILKEHEEHLSYSEKRKKETKKDVSSEVVEAPRAEGYYCIEYNMLPDDPEPTRVDLVMFGVAAKLYMANETKVLKPWREGNKVWVSWSQTLKLNVTKELLIKLASHKITVRVWDSKDKVSFKARNDRPKAFRLPQERTGEDPEQMVGRKMSVNLSPLRLGDGGIRKMVCEMRAVYEKENVKTSKSMKNHKDLVSSDYRKHLELRCATAPSKSGLTIEKSQTSPTKKTLLQKPTQDTPELTEDKQEKETASLELSVAPLLAGSTMLSDCMGFCSGGVQEGFWNITLDQPLLSEQLKAELNPLVITVLSASSLPSSPVPFHVLKAKCHSVYCQYTFHNMPVYRTKGHDHNANIFFKDVNVIFTGLLSPGKLCEFLKGPPMKIEVHDRDRKKERPSSTPAIFGTDPNDAKDDLWVTRNALKADTELHDPYGIAKLDLSDLLQGCRYLKLKLPIRSSSEVPSDIAMPVGHYLEADTQLKVQVEIAHTLHHEVGDSDRDCPFGRVIYVFKYNNTPVLAKLTSEILQINADAFQLKHYPEETIQRLLSGHKIRTKDRENKRLNVLTGFHMMDKALHLFVLEGFKDQAVKRLWTTVPIKLDGDEEEQVTALYNSDLSFSERLYDMLDVGLSPVCLVKPLETILMEPLVFIRNTVPHACLEALKCISHICKAKKLQEVVHHDLFPSADMILSLSKEFGSDLGRGELWLATETQQTQDIPDRHNIRKRTRTPLDNFNREYFQWKWNEGNNVKDFIQANIEDIHRASSDLQKSKPNVFLDNIIDGQTINYHNVQTTNSPTLLYREFSKDSTCISFFYPGFKSSIESNQHPKRPDDARIEELRKPWRENILHGNKLKPTLSRFRLPWIHRHQDFELYSKPPLEFGAELPLSIRLAGEALHEIHAQYNRWQRKMLLDESSTESGRVPEFRCHMRRAGLDKLQDILKDKPMKYSLKRPGMALKPIPVISVVQPSEKTGSAEREANIPFAPGPFQNHSLSWDKNTIPRYSSQYSKFHFRDYWRPHSFLHKRSVLPLTDEEKSKHSCQKPAEAPKTAMRTAHFKHSRNITEMRTNKDITLHVH